MKEALDTRADINSWTPKWHCGLLVSTGTYKWQIIKGCFCLGPSTWAGLNGSLRSSSGYLPSSRMQSCNWNNQLAESSPWFSSPWYKGNFDKNGQVNMITVLYVLKQTTKSSIILLEGLKRLVPLAVSWKLQGSWFPSYSHSVHSFDLCRRQVNLEEWHGIIVYLTRS